ncbi:MAG: hypothetical protein IPL96_06430 [Holophagaceae bacterium]|nr:hypothetical protein [Holophagaceae bacterium]
MDARLARLIADYLAAVEAAVALLERSGIPRPATNIAWAKLRLPATGELLGGVPYRKHGYGCAVQLPEGTVEFDFGPQGRIDGFADWRLRVFAGTRLEQYGFHSEGEFLAVFAHHVAAGELVHSGFVLHYLNGARA